VNDDGCLDEKTAGALKAFRMACINAHYDLKWKDCAYRQCRRRKRCLGGPRGTFSKFGVPRCHGEDRRWYPPQALRSEPQGD